MIAELRLVWLWAEGPEPRERPEAAQRPAEDPQERSELRELREEPQEELEDPQELEWLEEEWEEKPPEEWEEKPPEECELLEWELLECEELLWELGMVNLQYCQSERSEESVLSFSAIVRRER